jgi:hypothetical protein
MAKKFQQWEDHHANLPLEELLRLYGAEPPTLEEGFSRLDNLAALIGEKSDRLDRKHAIEDVQKIKKFFIDDVSDQSNRIEVVHAFVRLLDMFGLALRISLSQLEKLNNAEKARSARRAKAATGRRANEIISRHGHDRWLAQPKQRTPNAIANAIAEKVNKELVAQQLPEFKTDAIRKRLKKMIQNWTAEQPSN